jgi:hypothetical protein
MMVCKGDNGDDFVPSFYYCGSYYYDTNGRTTTETINQCCCGSSLSHFNYPNESSHANKTKLQCFFLSISRVFLFLHNRNFINHCCCCCGSSHFTIRIVITKKNVKRLIHTNANLTCCSSVFFLPPESDFFVVAVKII